MPTLSLLTTLLLTWTTLFVSAAPLQNLYHDVVRRALQPAAPANPPYPNPYFTYSPAPTATATGTAWPTYTAPASNRTGTAYPTAPAAPTGYTPYPPPSYPTGTAPASPTSTATTGTCSVDGEILCNGMYQFGECAFGKVTWQPVALGTQCKNGAITWADWYPHH